MGEQTGLVLALAFLFVFLFLAAQYESWSVPVGSSSLNLIVISCPARAAFNSAATKKPKIAPASKSINPKNVLNSLSKHSGNSNYKFERLYRVLFNCLLYTSRCV